MWEGDFAHDVMDEEGKVREGVFSRLMCPMGIQRVSLPTCGRCGIGWYRMV